MNHSKATVVGSPNEPAHIITYTILVIGLVIVFAIYWPGLHGSFFFDDEPNILQVPGIRLEHLSIDTIKQALISGHSGPSGRPVAQLSFALNYYISDYDPFAFKLTNLVIHELNGILVFFVALTLFATYIPNSEKASLLAGITAFGWLIHPIQLTSTLYVVQRMTSLSAFFLLLAFLIYIRARQQYILGRMGIISLLLALVILWLLSINSKETGILLPGFIAAYELIVRRSTHGHLDTIGYAVFLLSVGAITGAILYLISPLSSWLWSGYEFRSFSLSERLLTEARVLWKYLGLIMVPHLEEFAINHDDIPLSSGLITPWVTLPAVLGIAPMLWLCWWTRKKFPIISFGITWFFLGHSFESTVLPLEIAHEHRNYLPLFGLCLLIVSVFSHLIETFGVRRAISIWVCSAILGYLCFITALRAHLYGDEIRRTQIEAQYHPDSTRANYEAGAILTRVFRANPKNVIPYVLGRKSYERAGELDQAFKLSFLGMIYLDCLAGELIDNKLVDELAKRLSETLFAPGDRNVLFSLKEMSIEGTLCLPSPDIERLFEAALDNPHVPLDVQAMLHSWHADYLWLHEHDAVAAKKALEKSLRLIPLNSSNRLKWAQLLVISGEELTARKLLLELRDEKLLDEERKTLSELLTGIGERNQ